MKKLGAFLIPIVMVLGFSLLSTRMLNSDGGVNPLLFGVTAIILVVLMISFRSKSGNSKSAEAVMAEVLDDYAKDAFAGNEELQKKFYAALTDYGKNMPKSALAKLEKLEPACTEDKDVYAVSMMMAKIYFSLQKYFKAIHAYKRALLKHRTSPIACAIGDCYQRLGELGEARDSYEFAIDLDPKNIEAYSRLATAYVADWEYETALSYAEKVLELDEKNASALATTAICHGLLDDPVMCKHYTRLAVENGYSEKKINETIDALKKKSK